MNNIWQPIFFISEMLIVTVPVHLVLRLSLMYGMYHLYRCIIQLDQAVFQPYCFFCHLKVFKDLFFYQVCCAD